MGVSDVRQNQPLFLLDNENMYFQEDYSSKTELITHMRII